MSQPDTNGGNGASAPSEPSGISREALTPMMQQYLETKSRYPGCILFFRLGDFYEMFFDDAVNVSRWLNLTLTSRAKGDDAVPMCGVPHHASAHYISKLVDMGHRVAICDQVEDPRLAKGIVKREVTRVVSPGMVLNPDALDGKADNYMSAVVYDGTSAGLAFLDLSTGSFRVTQVPSAQVREELAALAPREIVASSQASALLGTLLEDMTRLSVTVVEEILFNPDRSRRALCDQFKVASLAPFGGDDMPLAVRAAGALLAYVKEMQRTDARHVAPPVPFRRGEFMRIDETAARNLEIFASMADGRRAGSLLAVLDFTVTHMGGRTLKSWLQFPLLDPEAINARLGAVSDLAEAPAVRREAAAALEGIHDLERLVSKAALRLANARDLRALSASLGRLPGLKAALARVVSPKLSGLRDSVDTLDDLRSLLDRAIADDPPPTINEGGMIREGFNGELDSLIRLTREGKGFISGLESQERARTGIGSLKVRYNKVFGYYIEVTKPNLHLVPQDYIRKQTTVNAERFITPELKDFEEKVSTAEERRFSLEYEIFTGLRETVAGASSRIGGSAAAVGEIDALLSYALAADAYGYCRPELDTEPVLEIEEGRHPVVERTMKESRFVPNDMSLGPDGCRLMVITGPNMAGKSTVMRQAALIVIMAQAGSFVPAKRARIGTADRVFTRIGAGDALSRGLSTFMVEMIEVATILNQATPKSLVLLDEIGRGTSTYDGLSLAWSIAEEIHDRVGARSMLATHYHELTDLALTKPHIRNFTIAVREWQDQIVFLRRLVEGGASRSYGIQVARLAGLPSGVIERAREILKNLEAGEFDSHGMPRVAGREGRGTQLALFHGGGDGGDEVLAEIKASDADTMTPIEALNLLSKLKRRLVAKK